MVTPLGAGEPAPFNGVLYPTENAIRVTNKAERCDFLLNEQETHCQRRLTFEGELCQQVIDLHADAEKRRDLTLGYVLPPWALVAIGYVVGAAMVVIGTWTVRQLDG